MPAQPLTEEQKADAARLKTIYLRVKTHNPSLTQATLAEACGWNTQGAVSQYINGKIPLNASAASKFAANLGCGVADISPSIAAEISELSQGIGEPAPLPADLPPEDRQFIGDISSGLAGHDIPEHIRQTILTLIASSPEKKP